ncbi:hypothetical protein [Cellulosimicrobium sp. 22601]|uniref:hypothetical protein n=1 Tax=unclassified Cellulosimicrobium TaxID=2624466 RepID=UPI003F8557BA
MTKRKAPAAPQDEELFDLTMTPTGEKRRLGRTERKVFAAIRAARKEKALSATEEPLAWQALSLARMVDHATLTKPDPYAVAAASRELREVLVLLRFAEAPVKAAAAPEVDERLDAFLADLGTPDAPAPAAS